MRSSKPAFGVGTAKSGTHYLASLFGAKATHEPRAEALIALVLHRARGALDDKTFAALVAQLLIGLDVALNVSQINGFIIAALAELFPDGRFVLTLRDCLAFVRSFVNHQLSVNLPPNSLWHDFRTLRFRPQDFPHGAQDAALRSRGLYSVDAYMGYWLRHNAEVIRVVDPAQLMIVPTADLAGEAEAIADFVEMEIVPRGARDEFAARYRTDPLADVDPAYLRARAAWHSATLVEKSDGRLPPRVARRLLGE